MTVGQSPTPDESGEVSYQRSKLDGTICDDGTNYRFDSRGAAASSSHNGTHIASLPVTIASLPHAGPPGGAGAAGESSATVSRASPSRGTLCVDTGHVEANPYHIDRKVSIQESDVIHKLVSSLFLQAGSATKHIHLGLHTRHGQIGPKTRYLASHANNLNAAIRLLVPDCEFQGITIHQGKNKANEIFISSERSVQKIIKDHGDNEQCIILHKCSSDLESIDDATITELIDLGFNIPPGRLHPRTVIEICTSPSSPIGQEEVTENITAGW